ncbi:NAD(P)-dependent oxidoreductase [Actinobacteria bacterium YIM 96077]|uniref:Sulfolactaldehyde 3-reductase n=1 Tax=Phytoactinopolyspora halophila TaxID=1981511 RepID=A0A329QCW4_9ACTN|nr:NAD(P)-dependent oxidoreductase [Phytoactinopolyspora halophila]AYY11820.1 NAD(P)-dependent oxidoreductase [Actinobacteria bacterium YIM 96077]RAW09841.1 sulfolactaldehyde 3-reductase [Phytoactinopolyspora halophila]
MARIGFIGLGAMGAPMATNILAGGHQLMVYDTNSAAVEALRELGADIAADVSEMAESRDVIITMLPHPTAVEEIVLGPDGLVASGLRPGRTFVDMSTGDPLTAQRLAETLESKGVFAVDCPVGRTPEHAKEGALLLLAGGSSDAVERARPVLMCMGDELVHCGGPGTGQAMKLVNNMLTITVMQGVGEVLGVGLQAGLPLDLMREVTAKTLAQTSVMDKALPAKAFVGDLSPGFALRLAEKDIRLAVQLAANLSLSTPVAERALQRCTELVASGHADHDIGILAAEQAGLDKGQS